MRVLVIGGTGFIGPHVVRRLVAQGHELTVFHRGQTEAELPQDVAHLHGDRERLEHYRPAFERIGPEVVVDVRPLTRSDSEQVMRVFQGVARRVVALSSGDVYRAYGLLQRSEAGPLQALPIAESAELRSTLFPYRGAVPRSADDPMRWVDDYEKILVERAVMEASDLPGTVLRLPMVYGPGDSNHRLFPYLKRMDDGRAAILLDEGFAAWRWTRSYVENVAEAIALAVSDDRAAGQIYNVGEPQALTEAEWVAAIGAAAGWRGHVVRAPSDVLPPALRQSLNFDQHLETDTSRLRAELGYHETVSCDEALRRTITWERANPRQTIDPSQFDYAAEDALIARLAAAHTGDSACTC